jgi:hypothetical protein
MKKRTQEGLLLFANKIINIIYYDKILEGTVVGIIFSDSQLLVDVTSEYNYDNNTKAWQQMIYSKPERKTLTGKQYKNLSWFCAWALPDSKFIKDFKDKISYHANKKTTRDVKEVYKKIYQELINNKNRVIYDYYYSHSGLLNVREVHYNASNFKIDNSNGNIYLRTGQYGSSYFKEFKLTSINRKFFLSKTDLYLYLNNSNSNASSQLTKIIKIFNLKIGMNYTTTLENENIYIFQNDLSFHSKKGTKTIPLVDCNINFLISLKEEKED